MEGIKENWFQKECKRRQQEEEEENLKKCEKYLGKDYTNVCGPWAMKVCAREGFMLAGPYRNCYRRSCRCQACRVLSERPRHSETVCVHQLGLCTGGEPKQCRKAGLTPEGKVSSSR